MWLRKRSRDLLMFLCVMAVPVDAFAQQPKEFRIMATEFSFKPSTLQVPQGGVKITVTNRGKFLHGLAIVGRDEKIAYIEPGDTQSLTLKFNKAEQVVFYCPQPGHRNKGMEGKLTVGR